MAKLHTSIAANLRDLAPVWFVCILAPAPTMLIPKSGAAGLMYFFVACASLVAYAFRHEIDDSSPSSVDENGRTWRLRLLSCGIALLAAWLVFAGLCVTLRPPHGFVAAWLSLLILVPCLCIVPYMLLVTRQPFTAVVFSMTLVVLVKLAGCAVVVAVYGWDASEFGHTGMPWMRPNLLVWCFFVGTTILSAVCFLLAARRYRNCAISTLECQTT